MPGDGRQITLKDIIVENSSAPKVYEESFKVHTYEVDIHNRLTIQALAQFLQEAASNHAALLGFGVEYLLKNNRTWVLSRLAIEIEEFIPLGETITIKTWPADTEKLFFIRDFEIRNSQGSIIGSATSYWIFIDTEKGRPVHPSKNEIVFDYDNIERGFKRPLSKLPALEKLEPCKFFHVRYSDLDLNNHVNNIKYIEWGMEGIDPDYRINYIPFLLEINFLSEAKYGNQVELSMEKDTMEKDTMEMFSHSLFIDNKEICRIQSVWKTMWGRTAVRPHTV
jgi:acyl-ACP thioesterase